MRVEFDRDTSEFLKALGPGTRKIYTYGLTAFQDFYKPQGTVKSFLDRVEEDALKQRREKTRVARNAIKEFVEWLQAKGYKPKTVRAYVAAVQSLAKYFDLAVSTSYVNLPTARPFSQKYPWTIEAVAEFVEAMKKPMHRAIAVTIFQSGLGISDVLALTYGDIQREFEQGTAPLCLDLSRIKTDVPFMTFIGAWGVSLLKRHLDGRKLNARDRLFEVTPRAVDRCFARVGRRFAGDYEGNCPCRPHSLRAAFRTLLSDHRVDPLFIEFWMGHKVAEQQRVYVSKSREGWRETYRTQAEPWLTPKEAPLNDP